MPLEQLHPVLLHREMLLMGDTVAHRATASMATAPTDGASEAAAFKATACEGSAFKSTVNKPVASKASVN